MKKLLIVFFALALTGCAAVDTVKKYWPRDHDPVMFDYLVTLSVEIDNIDCANPDWSAAIKTADHLTRYAEWRGDPQYDNIRGFATHVRHMSRGGSRTFCELGKTAAEQRIDVARRIWGDR